MTPQVDGIHYHHTTLLLHPATPNFFRFFSIKGGGSTLPKFPKLLIHGGYRYLHMKIDDNSVLEFNLEELIGFDPNEPLIDFCLEDLPVFDDLECPDLKELICIFLHFLVFFCFLRQDLIIGEPSPGVRKEFFFRFFWVFLGFFLSGVMVQPVILAWPLQVGSLDLYHRRRLETTVITSFSSTPYSLKTLYLSSGRFLPSSLHM